MHAWLCNPYRFIFLPAAMLPVLSTVMKQSRHPNWLSHMQFQRHNSSPKSKSKDVSMGVRRECKSVLIILSSWLWLTNKYLTYTARLQNLLARLVIKWCLCNMKEAAQVINQNVDNSVCKDTPNAYSWLLTHSHWNESQSREKLNHRSCAWYADFGQSHRDVARVKCWVTHMLICWYTKVCNEQE